MKYIPTAYANPIPPPNPGGSIIEQIPIEPSIWEKLIEEPLVIIVLLIIIGLLISQIIFKLYKIIFRTK